MFIDWQINYQQVITFLATVLTIIAAVSNIRKNANENKKSLAEKAESDRRANADEHATLGAKIAEVTANLHESDSLTNFRLEEHGRRISHLEGNVEVMIPATVTPPVQHSRPVQGNTDG